MIDTRKYRLAVLMALCCLAWAACTQERQPCYTPKNATLNIRCIHRQTDTSTVFVDTALPATLLAALTDSGRQLIIYRTQASSFPLSLSSVSDSSKWGITTDTFGRTFDTLTFFYQRKLQF